MGAQSPHRPSLSHSWVRSGSLALHVVAGGGVVPDLGQANEGPSTGCGVKRITAFFARWERVTTEVEV